MKAGDAAADSLKSMPERSPILIHSIEGEKIQEAYDSSNNSESEHQIINQSPNRFGETNNMKIGTLYNNKNGDQALFNLNAAATMSIFDSNFAN